MDAPLTPDDLADLGFDTLLDALMAAPRARDPAGTDHPARDPERTGLA